MFFRAGHRRGILPGSISGIHRGDRRAVDTLLDRASGLQTTIATTNEEKLTVPVVDLAIDRQLSRSGIFAEA